MSKAKEIFEKAVEKFAADLKKGKNPFAAPMVPMNGNTKRPYSGFNRWHLASVSRDRGYKTCAWLTMKQANTLGGHVKKGEKSTPVFMWGFTFVFSGDISASGHSLEEALKKARKKDASLKKGDLVRKVPFLKMFHVFELSQLDGVEIEFEFEEGPMTVPHDDFVAHSGPTFAVSSFDYYDEATDMVMLSDLKEGEKHLAYAPLIEWTAHKERLNREHELAKERLVQAFGEAFLCQYTGVEPGEVNEKYIEEWLQLLGQNPYFLWRAAGDAEKAAKYLLENAAAALCVAA